MGQNQRLAVGEGAAECSSVPARRPFKAMTAFPAASERIPKSMPLCGRLHGRAKAVLDCIDAAEARLGVLRRRGDLQADALTRCPLVRGATGAGW